MQSSLLPHELAKMQALLHMQPTLCGCVLITPLRVRFLTTCTCPAPRPQELAKFPAVLQKQGATQLSDMVRGRQRLAYPIKR